ncbi:AMP-binding protein, partial [Gammaproteobacteria bacterium]|nr:AMP-binding protein [Gammaproteobacteria bacterium]
MKTELPKNKMLWRLAEDKKPQTSLWQFADSTQQYHHGAPDDYAALHDWSIKSPHEFYSSLWGFLDIIGDKGEVAYVANDDIKHVEFYPDATVNYAENLLQNPDDRPAIIAYRDDGVRRAITRKQLYDQVSLIVQALQAEGVKEGDRVAAIVCNDIEAIVGYLATAAIGAIWSSCSPDFGPNAASDRLGQIDPSVLLAVSHYAYSGKHFDVTPTIKAVADACNLKRVILINEPSHEQLNQLPCISMNDWLKPFQVNKIVFNRLPYSSPLAILFSSGTTGQPKCIIHSAMGLLIQHKKELKLHCDLKPEERFFYFTTCGWMMWNWMVSGLALEATLITYDGNPFYPKQDHLLDLIDDENINLFGTSAKYIDACQNFKLTPQSTHSLESLRLLLSTGSPLIPSNFDYIYDHWKSD